MVKKLTYSELNANIITGYKDEIKKKETRSQQELNEALSRNTSMSPSTLLWKTKLASEFGSPSRPQFADAFHQPLQRDCPHTEADDAFWPQSRRLTGRYPVRSEPYCRAVASCEREDGRSAPHAFDADAAQSRRRRFDALAWVRHAVRRNRPGTVTQRGSG